MSEDTTRTIEINGVKIDVDLRQAHEHHTYQVGQPVRLLMKKWSDNYESHPAVICGFDAFVNRPSIRVLYVATSGEIETVDIHDGCDHEIAPRESVDHLINRTSILGKMDRAIEQKEREIEELVEKKNVFVEQFGAFFEQEKEQKEG